MQERKENLLAFIYIFRNKLNALFGDDPDFTIYEIDEPLPDGTMEIREDGHTLNIVCSDVAKLTIARDHIGDTFEDGEMLYIDYYYSRNNSSFVNAKNRPSVNTPLDIAQLFEGNPHFSKFYSGYGMFGPWFCIAFKPELIQYYNEDTTTLHGKRSCAMEDIARDVFYKDADNKIFFGTENLPTNIGSCYPNTTATISYNY